MEYTEDLVRSEATRTEHYFFTKAEWRKVLETAIGKPIPASARTFDNYPCISPAVMRNAALEKAGKKPLKLSDQEKEGGYAVRVITTIE